MVIYLDTFTFQGIRTYRSQTEPRQKDIVAAVSRRNKTTATIREDANAGVMVPLLFPAWRLQLIIRKSLLTELGQVYMDL